jgi:hypothetical protein
MIRDTVAYTVISRNRGIPKALSCQPGLFRPEQFQAPIKAAALLAIERKAPFDSAVCKSGKLQDE